MAGIYVQDKPKMAEQVMECRVLEKATKGSIGEHWVFLVMPDGKRILLRVSDCKLGEVREEPTY